MGLKILGGPSEAGGDRGLKFPFFDCCHYHIFQRIVFFATIYYITERLMAKAGMMRGIRSIESRRDKGLIES